MKVLVTGATSLLGRHVAQQLLARGDEVTCFQRHPSAVESAEVLGDIRDAAQVTAVMKGHDAVIHLAALVAPRPRYDQAYAVNVTGTINVALAARSAGRMVYVSSPSVAFAHAPVVGVGALPPTYTGRDVYTRTKALAEIAALESGVGATVVVRPHLVWGPGDTQLLGRVAERARAGRLVLPDGGRALVDTTYVSDAAASLVSALDRTGDDSTTWGQAYVVTGGEPRPLGELIRLFLAAMDINSSPRSWPAPLVKLLGGIVDRAWWGSEPPITSFAAQQLSMAHWFDQSETRRALRWAPSMGLEGGLAQLRGATRNGSATT